MDLDSDLFTYGVLPLLIFISRLLDVPLGTVRIIFLARGMRVAALIGFFEVVVWAVAIGQVLANLTNPVCYVAYAGGFAVGNLLGLKVEEWLAVGKQVVRVFVRTDARGLVDELRGMDFGVTTLDAYGRAGLVLLVYTVVARRDVPRVIEAIGRHNPRAFYVVEDVQQVSDGGIFPPRAPGRRLSLVRK